MNGQTAGILDLETMSPSESPDTHAHPALPDASRAELVLNRLTQLPALPTVALKVLEVTTSDRSSAEDVVRLIETDAALTARILRLLHRADLGVRPDVVTVKRAVVLLGFSAVRNAVLSIQVYDTFSKMEGVDAAADTGLVRAEFWKHSLAVACAAQGLARRMSGSAPCPDQAFVCGLLHDIGKIALDACFPKSYARVVRRVRLDATCICDVERDVLGLDHTVAGKRLVSLWRLPRPIFECVWLHHQAPEALPESLASKSLVHVVHVADALARSRRLGFSGYSFHEDVRRQAAGLGLSPDVLTQVGDELPERIAAMAELFGIDDTSPEEVPSAMLVRANSELARVNAELIESNRALTRQAGFFEAMFRFTRARRSDESVGAVCQAVAEAVGRLLDIAGAVVYAPDASRAWATVGTWYADRDGACELVEALASPAEHDSPEARSRNGMGRVSAAGGVRLRGADEAELGLFDRFVASAESAASARGVWALPMSAGGERVGVVLFSAEPEDVRRFEADESSWEALAATFGLALSYAQARSQFEHLTEELVDAHRRLNAAKADALQARSLSMIAEMSAGAAHELNNPLAVIAGRAQMLLEDCDSGDAERGLGIIAKQAQRASDIVSELMAFAKPDPPHPEPIALADLLCQSRDRWRDRCSLSAEQIELDPPDSNVHVMVDREVFFKIVDALMANAIEATNPENARIIINSPTLPSDETVRIRIQDNGVGMTPEVLEHACDPFYSSRPAGRGRGLGLSYAQRMARISGGRLHLESTPEHGTTVHLELPAHHT